MLCQWIFDLGLWLQHAIFSLKNMNQLLVKSTFDFMLSIINNIHCSIDGLSIHLERVMICASFSDQRFSSSSFFWNYKCKYLKHFIKSFLHYIAYTNLNLRKLDIEFIHEIFHGWILRWCTGYCTFQCGLTESFHL